MVRLVDPPRLRGLGKTSALGSAARAARSTKTTRPEPIAYQGKRSNASILQSGLFTTTVTLAGSGEDGDPLTIIRLFGTNLAMSISLALATQTEDVGAGAGYKTITMTLGNTGGDGAIVAFRAPMVGLEGGTPNIINWGGIAGPVLWLDETDVGGSVTYTFDFNMVGFDSIVLQVLWQEIRR